MASTVYVREYSDVKHGRVGETSHLLRGDLATDELGLPVESVATVNNATRVNTGALTPKTNFVVIASGAVAIHYAIRPKSKLSIPIIPSSGHPKIAANSEVVVAVYPGCIIDMVEV